MSKRDRIKLDPPTYTMQEYDRIGMECESLRADLARLQGDLSHWRELAVRPDNVQLIAERDALQARVGELQRYAAHETEQSALPRAQDLDRIRTLEAALRPLLERIKDCHSEVPASVRKYADAARAALDPK